MKYNKLILIFVLLILFLNIVNADLVFDEVICSKDGSLEFVVYSKDNKINTNDIKVIARQKDPFLGINILDFEVNGTWNKNYISREKINFKSKYAEINNPGNYDIILNYVEDNLNKNIVWTLDCLGLIFSCDLINVDIKNCTNIDNKYFNLLVELSGLNQSVVRQIDLFEDFNYGVVAENKYMDIKGLESDKGSLPEKIKINKINNGLYLFSKEFGNNNILSINFYLKSLESECKDSNLYDYQECIKIYTKGVEIENNITKIKEEKIETKEASKITGESIKISENKSLNKNYLIYIVIGLIILVLIIIIIKNKKLINGFE